MKNNKVITIGAIIIAGLIIIGIAIYSPKSKNQNKKAIQKPIKTEQLTKSTSTLPTLPIPPLSENDHILGNPQAEIIIVEYSDIECPFCKQFHQTLSKIIEEYGKKGKVSWVYRHFPLTMLHPTAEKEAEATECAAELGGNEKFWQFLNNLVATSFSQKNLEEKLSLEAEKIGLESKKFKNCLESGKYSQKIKKSFQEAVKAGAKGTPFSILITGKKFIPLEGALPYESFKKTIEILLSAEKSKSKTNF